MKLVDTLSRLVLVGASVFGSSCGDRLEPCKEAQDRLDACLNLACICQPARPEITRCEGAERCAAQCITDVSCEVIKDSFSGMETALSQPFRDCLASCQMP